MALLVVTCATHLVLAPRASTGAGGPAAAPTPTQRQFGALPNLVQNSSFEMDWMHNRVAVATRFQLLEQSDWGYGQSDGLPDSWVARHPSRLDRATARFGSVSLRLRGTAWQVVYLLGQTLARGGGANYNPFAPLPPALTAAVAQRPMRFGAWCKAEQATAKPSLSVTLEHAQGGLRRFDVAFDPGTHGWQYREVDVPPSPAHGVAHAAVVRLSYNGGGKAWFDGVAAVEQIGRDEPNLLPNGGFEATADGWPARWAKPALWTWSRRNYYRFTGWSHGKGRMAGGARLSPHGRNGGQALRLTVLPGDNLAVASDPIRLNQSQARPLQVSAWVRADNLRWLEIMARDDRGRWLPQHDFSGFMGTDEQYRNRIVGIGSHEWAYVSKHLAPSEPVKELTLWLCARGFDGKLMRRHEVGTVWLDDVELRERGTTAGQLAGRGVSLPPAAPRAEARACRVVAFDPGERLWGENELRLRVHNPAGRPQRFEATWQLRAPSGGMVPVVGKAPRVPPGGQAEGLWRYRLDELCADWQQHYELAGPVPLTFGTAASPLSVRLAKLYVYPDETLDVGINLNVTRRGLGDVASCEVVVEHPGGKKTAFRTTDVAAAMWTPETAPPAMLAAGHVDAARLIAVSIRGDGLPVHPAAEPVRDCRVVATLTGRDGKVIATRSTERFGLLRRPRPPRLPDRIKRTHVDRAGVLRVNGQPFVFNTFPTDRTDLGAVDRRLNFPKTHKILPLPFPKELTFAAAAEAAWRAKIEAFVKANKSDPKLFGYFFAHGGETTFWFKDWQRMAACQRKVAAWVRRIDPDHVILSARWLFGHGALKPETGKHFDFLDVIDVEPGLMWAPQAHALRRAAGRGICVIAGLECYYFQPIGVLRWRVYEVLRQGANGIGICPSNMLHPRPETVSYLRGLHGEVEGLRPLLTGSTPSKPTTCDDPAITLWERQAGAARYLVAMRGKAKPGGPPGPVTFTLPAPAAAAHVMFEGRTIPFAARTFTDRLDEPFTVRVYRMAAPADPARAAPSWLLRSECGL